MKTEYTKQDMFYDYIKEQGPENPTWKVREDLKARHFWSDEEIASFLDKHLDADVRRHMRLLPKVDEDGNVIERIHVTRRNKDGTKEDIYVQRSFLPLEDTIQAIQYRHDRGSYFFAERDRLFEDGLERFRGKKREKLIRTFQGIFDFASPV